VSNGYLDGFEASKALDYEHVLLAYMKTQHSTLMDSIDKTGDFNDDIAAQLTAALDDFATKGSW
jgi:F-type H+-transporting ATPase subunit alpha